MYMENLNKTDIGLIGLAVMGENLALNMADKGWNVSVYNRTVPGVEEGVVERFINGRAKGKSIQGYTDISDFVSSIKAPRKIMMMVRAGSAVDELMEQLFPYLSAGDILIDGGNSNYEDTNRRVALAEKKGFRFVGAGVSGGEEGALNGASECDKQAYQWGGEEISKEDTQDDGDNNSWQQADMEFLHKY